MKIKKSIAKMLLFTSLVLSAFSVAGAIATGGKDGPEPFPPTGPGSVQQYTVQR